MPGIRIALTLAMLPVVVTGCGGPTTNPVALDYQPSISLPVRPADNVVAMGPVIDARGSMLPNVLGTAADKLGRQQESLISKGRVTQAVSAAFTDALMARGLLAPPGEHPFVLTVRILRLGANQAWREHAVAEFALSLTSGRDGPVVYSERVRAAARETGPFTIDAYGYVPVAAVGDLLQNTMNRAIDEALDKPGFLAAVGRPEYGTAQSTR